MVFIIRIGTRVGFEFLGFISKNIYCLLHILSFRL